MDESALRILLSTLDASRSSWHGLLHVFTWFVIVGLGFDLFVIIKEFRDDWKDFRYGQVHPYEIHLPKRPSVWLLILGLVGTALIVIGVAGELHVDVKVAKVETDIRAANDALLGLIIQEAGTAKSSAEGAAEAASGAKESADAAQRYTEQIRADLEVATKAARKAESELAAEQRQTAEAQEKAAHAQLILETYVSVFSKNLTARRMDCRRAIEQLKHTTKGSVEIWYEPDDEEATDFASQVYRCLGRDGAGWEVQSAPFSARPETTELRKAANSSGIAIASKNSDIRSNAALWALRQAITLGVGGWNIAGLEWVLENPKLPDGHFIIAVGHHQAKVPWEFSPQR
jgi:hypothetical protein